MQDWAVFCLMCRGLTDGPASVVTGKAKGNIYLEKSILGNKWPHLQLRQVRMSVLLAAEAHPPLFTEDPGKPGR